MSILFSRLFGWATIRERHLLEDGLLIGGNTVCLRHTVSSQMLRCTMYCLFVVRCICLVAAGHAAKVFHVKWSPLRDGVLCSGSDDG